MLRGIFVLALFLLIPPLLASLYFCRHSGRWRLWSGSTFLTTTITALALLYIDSPWKIIAVILLLGIVPQVYLIIELYGDGQKWLIPILCVSIMMALMINPFLLLAPLLQAIPSF